MAKLVFNGNFNCTHGTNGIHENKNEKNQYSSSVLFENASCLHIYGAQRKHLYVRYCRCLARLLEKRRDPKKIKQKTIPNWIDEKQSAYISCDRIENVDIQPRTTSIWWRAQFKQSNVFLKANTYVALAFCFHLMFRLFLLHSIRFRYSLFSVFDFLSTNEKTKLIDENDSQYLCSHWKLYRLLALNPIQNQK